MSHANFSVMAVLFFAPQLVQSADEPTFKTVIRPDSIRFAQVFSVDKKVGAMVFDNFVAATEIGRGSLPSVQTKTLTYALEPVSDKGVEVVQQIRGFVNSQGSGSASLVIHSGGETTLVDLAKAIAASKAGGKANQNTLHEAARKKGTDDGFTVDGRPKTSDEFFVEVRRSVATGKALQTTVSLLVDRLPGDDGSGAVLYIDSIDFEVVPAKVKVPVKDGK